MNTLERLRAEAKEKATSSSYQNYDGKLKNYTFKEENLDHLIEHTHTQTIQSVRERIEGMRYPAEFPDFDGGYNSALDDLLKDLEAPVEGNGV